MSGAQQALLLHGSHWPRVVAQLNMSGADASTTFTDDTGLRTWTANGNAQIDTSLGYNTGLFDGVGDYVSTPYTQASLDWWTSDVTIEAWVYATAWTTWGYLDGTLKPSMLGCANVGSTTNYWSFGPTTAGVLTFYYYNGTQQSITFDAATVPTSTLSHICFCKQGTGLYLGINGAVQYRDTVVGTPQSSTSGVVLTLGQINNASITGHVKALRITKHVSMYTSDYQPPPAPFQTS